MEHQWKEIKTAYKRILHNAFDTPEDRDRANIVLLKMIATVIDLSLSGDTTLKNATNALLGDCSPGVSSQRAARANQSNVPNTPNTPNMPNMSNAPNMPNMPNDMSNLPNVNNMFQIVDRLMNRNPAVPNDFITSEELRNLFPLWNMFERQDDRQDRVPSADASAAEDHNHNVSTG
jgi:hypothetical protein